MQNELSEGAIIQTFPKPKVSNRTSPAFLTAMTRRCPVLPWVRIVYFFADKAQEYKRHHHVAFFEERPGIARCPQDTSSLKENSIEIDCFFCFLFLGIFGFFGCLTESELCDFDCDALRGGIGFLDLIIAASAGDEAMDDLGKFVLFRRVFGVDFEG